jgi:hypothetical protein
MSHNIDKIILYKFEKRIDRREYIEQELNFGLDYEIFEDYPHC